MRYEKIFQREELEEKINLSSSVKSTFIPDDPNKKVIQVLLSEGNDDQKINDFIFQGIAHLVGKQDWKPLSQAHF